MNRSIQRAAALVSALVLLGGAFPTGDSVRNCVQGSQLTAHAEERKTVTINETTGLVTIRGNVDASAVKSLSKKTVVKKVVAEKGTVLPENSQGLFLGYCAESIDLSNVDTSQVTNMAGMFDSCKNLTELNLTGFDTSHVTDMNSMFANCSKLTSLDVTGFDTSKVTAMGSMFSGCSSLTELDVSGFKTPKVTKLSRMFQKCSSITKLNLGGFETAKVTEMENMFAGCTKLKTILVSTLFVTDKLEKTYAESDTFDGCTSLVGGNHTLYRSEHRNYVYARIDSFEEPGYFTAVRGMLPPDEFKDVVFDEETGTLTLSGQVNYTHVALYRENKNVKKVVAEKGTVLPPDCTDMFKQFMAEEIDLSKADTSRVTIMEGFFESCVNLTSVDLSGFQTANVTNMRDMFYNCEKLAAVDVSMLDTSKCETFYGMFRGCKALTALDLSTFNTARADSLNNMFYGCTALTELDLSSFDTSFASYFSGMFGDCESLASLNISTFRTPRALNLSYMFYNCKSLTALDLTKFDTAHVEKMDGMFLDCSGLTELDLRSFSQTLACDMSKLFGGCANLEKILVSDSWNHDRLTALNDGINNVYRSCYMFSGCEKLKGGNGTAYQADAVKLDMFRIDSAETPGYLTLGDDSVQPPELKFGAKLDEGTGVLTIYGDFTESGTGTLKIPAYNADITDYKNNAAVKSVVAAEGTILPADCSALFSGFLAETIDLTKADASHAVDLHYMFYNCPNLKTLNLSGLDFSSAEDASSMFMQCPALESIDLTGVRWLNLQRMNTMFSFCTSLKEIKGLAAIDTSKVWDMSDTFSHCEVLKGIDLSVMNLSSVENMSGMLIACEELQSISLSGLELPKVQNMSNLFAYNPSLISVDLSGLIAPNLIFMNSICANCSALKSVNLSGIQTDELKNMSYAFQNCKSLTDVNLSGLDTSGVVDLNSMFYFSTSLQTLDLSSIDTSSLTNTHSMFSGCQKLRTVYVSDKWDNSQFTANSASMFMGCSSLVGGNGTVYNKENMDGAYARIDTAAAPGYLTKIGAELPPVTETTFTVTTTNPTSTSTSTTQKPTTTTITSTAVSASGTTAATNETGTEPSFLLGDVNCDGLISVEDAQLTLNAYVQTMSGLEAELTDLQKKAADVNTDQVVSVDDAQLILIYYVENTISGNPKTWDELTVKTESSKSLPRRLASELLRVISMIGL